MIKKFFKSTYANLSALPIIDWVLLGFFISFCTAYLIPVFLNQSKMIFFEFVPAGNTIGMDFNEFRQISFNMDFRHFYPPLTILFFKPFTLFSQQDGFKILSFLTLFCFIFATYFLPSRLARGRQVYPLLMVILFSGILSYGFQFELERGQWNLIAFTFCMSAIYLFHRHPKQRWLAYILFSIAVQLKLFPAIFVFMLIDDWTEWRKNILRVSLLGIANVASLFILGIQPFLQFLQTVSSSFNQFDVKPANHSIKSFTHLLFDKTDYQGVMRLAPNGSMLAWLQANTWFIQLILFCVFGFCFLYILYQSYRHKMKGVNPYLMLACAIGACIIPSISYDYKLSILPAIMAIALPGILLSTSEPKRGWFIFLTLLLSTAYSLTLFSFVYKPVLLWNNFPILLLILLIDLAFFILNNRKTASNPLVKDPDQSASG